MHQSKKYQDMQQMMNKGSMMGVKKVNQAQKSSSNNLGNPPQINPSLHYQTQQHNPNPQIQGQAQVISSNQNYNSHGGMNQKMNNLGMASKSRVANVPQQTAMTSSQGINVGQSMPVPLQSS
mmetsp:Transcript_14185/g.24113  ORF Transcript_14185/g.24113 Transcript_14185/m.24113 type:complete len:122 (-) Transcript_14185:306-671(-)